MQIELLLSQTDCFTPTQKTFCTNSVISVTIEREASLHLTKQEYILELSHVGEQMHYISSQDKELQKLREVTVTFPPS